MNKLSTIVKTLDFVLKDAKKSKLDEDTINELVQIERKASMIKYVLKLQGTLGTKQNKEVLEFKLEIDKKEKELNKLKEEANLIKMKELKKKKMKLKNNIRYFLSIILCKHSIASDRLPILSIRPSFTAFFPSKTEPTSRTNSSVFITKL